MSTEDNCICNVGWGCGENGWSVCGAPCSEHPPKDKCVVCGKLVYGMACWKHAEETEEK